MRLPDLLPPSLLPPTEFAAMRLDGELYRVGSGWRPVDLPETAEARADAVAAEVGTAVVLDRATAAWVHGAAHSAPHVLTGCVPITARVAAGTRRRVELRELRLVEDELVQLGGVRVTDLARTAIDLLRGSWGPSERDVVAALVGMCGVAEVRDRLADRRFAAHRARTVARLAEVEAGVPDDRTSPLLRN